MITKIFTVYDSKCKAYLRPFHANSTGEAMRQFEDTCNDETHNFHIHSDDFTMFELGKFDDQTCKFTMLEDKIVLAYSYELVDKTKVEMLKQQAS